MSRLAGKVAIVTGGAGAIGHAVAQAMAAEGAAVAIGDLERERAEAAAGGKGLTQPQIIIENHRILVSQRATERADTQVRVAINEFNHYGSSCEQD